MKVKNIYREFKRCASIFVTSTAMSCYVSNVDVADMSSSVDVKDMSKVISKALSKRRKKRSAIIQEISDDGRMIHVGDVQKDILFVNQKAYSF